MAREYDFYIEVSRINPGRELAVAAAVREFGDFGDVDIDKRRGTVIARGEGRVSQTEAEVADDIARAVWKANDGFALLSIDMTPLEASGGYLRGEDDFKRLGGVL
jgi:hypothetical protein